MMRTPHGEPGLSMPGPIYLNTPRGFLTSERSIEHWEAHSAADLTELLPRARAWQAAGDAVAGLLAYDAGLALHGVGSRHRGARPLAALSRLPAGSATGLAATNDQAARTDTGFTSEMSQTVHQQAIERIHAYEAAGDCYQVNFARRFSARSQASALSLWQRLLAAHPAPWASYFPLQGGAVFGVSPECFLRVAGNEVTSRPIKGSRPRGRRPGEDAALAEELRDSHKDKSENIMIVDLVRNDLGQVCVPGSVRAQGVLALERFSNVQHLVSSVTGTLAPGIHPLEALLACFPGGSITGAPKRRAMEIIDELEPVARGFYCGTQFWLEDDWLEANILIRTFQQFDQQIVCHGGGGIVFDSEAASEFDESAFKVKALMDAISGER